MLHRKLYQIDGKRARIAVSIQWLALYTSPLWAGRSSRVYLAILRVRGRSTVADGLVIRELDPNGVHVGADTPVEPVDPIAMAYDGSRFGIVISENDVTDFATLGRDGHVGSLRIDIARSLITHSGTTLPAVGRLASRGDGFSLFYADAGGSDLDASYVSCAPNSHCRTPREE